MKGGIGSETEEEGPNGASEMLAFPKGERKGIIYPLSLLRVPSVRLLIGMTCSFGTFAEKEIWQTASFRLLEGLPTARSAMGKNLEFLYLT